MKVAKIIFVSAAIALSVAASASAGTITCPTVGSTADRYGTVTGVSQCVWMGPVTGTPKASDVEDAFGFGPWYNGGAVAGGSGTNGYLTIGLTSGSWGSLPVSGTYAVDPAVWAFNVPVALTFHLGNGGGNPDWFFFLLDQGTTSGTFEFWRASGNGGGFSNAFLWIDPPPGCDLAGCDETPVPEPASLLLLGTGLVFAASRLRKRAAARK